MLKELDTPEWEKLFNNPPLVARDITRESVVRVIVMQSPKHEPEPEFCRMLCGLGFLGVFQLCDDRFLAVKADCEAMEFSCNLNSNCEELIDYAFCPHDRELLGIATAEDKAFDAMYAYV